jgi:hypothetical protein
VIGCRCCEHCLIVVRQGVEDVRKLARRFVLLKTAPKNKSYEFSVGGVNEVLLLLRRYASESLLETHPTSQL